MASAGLNASHPWDTEIEGSFLAIKFPAFLETRGSPELPKKGLDPWSRDTMWCWSALSPSQSSGAKIEIPLSSEKSLFQAPSGALLLKPEVAIELHHLRGVPTDSSDDANRTGWSLALRAFPGSLVSGFLAALRDHRELVRLHMSHGFLFPAKSPRQSQSPRLFFAAALVVRYCL